MFPRNRAEQQELDKRSWPFNTSYAQNCKKCTGAFYGPKRAPMCWTCASQEQREKWHMEHMRNDREKQARVRLTGRI